LFTEEAYICFMNSSWSVDHGGAVARALIISSDQRDEGRVQADAIVMQN
jgi:hypothetical protein